MEAGWQDVPAPWTLVRPPLQLETSMPGVFVASAVAEGSIAATQMYQYLQQQARSS